MVVCLFSACNDDDDDKIPQGPAITYAGKLPSRIGDYTFVYDDNNRCTQVKNNSYVYGEIDYDKGVVIMDDEEAKVSFNSDGYVTGISASWNYNEDGYSYKGSGKISFSYNGNGQLVSYTESSSESGKEDGESFSSQGSYKATYTWKDGNLIKVVTKEESTEDGEKYATYTNQDNLYMSVEGNTFVKDDGQIYGKIFEYRFYENEEKAQLGIKNIDNINNNTNGTIIDMLYSPSGLKQNDEIIVQKQIVSKKVDEFVEHTINIQSIRLGLKLNSSETTLSTAKLKTTLYNPLDIEIDKLTMEIWHSKDKDAKPNWNEATTKDISISELGNITLENLSPAEYYYIRFKYLEDGKYLYTYDKDTQEIGRVYKIETLATINIRDIKVKYTATNYKNKTVTRRFMFLQTLRKMVAKFLIIRWSRVKIYILQKRWKNED